MRLAIFLQTLPLVLGYFSLYIAAPLGSQGYMTVTGKMTSEGVSETKPPTQGDPDHTETCPDHHLHHRFADEGVCGDRPHFYGGVFIEFESPTANPRPITIDMLVYTLSVSTVCVMRSRS
jgi:hypothetical protein